MNRNPLKQIRRDSLKRIMTHFWGDIKEESVFDNVIVPDLNNKTILDKITKILIDSIESCRNRTIKGKVNLKLKFDYYIPSLNIAVEFDEKQHFTNLRAKSLKSYPSGIKLGFNKQKWIKLCEEIDEHDDDPIYRDEQRAFYDSLRDIYFFKNYLKPVIRIYENDVSWENEDFRSLSQQAKAIIESIVLASKLQGGFYEY